MLPPSNRISYALYGTNFLLRIEWGISTSMLPIYIYELGGSSFEVSLVFTVFASIMIFSNIFWGVISDYFGKRKIFIVMGMMCLTPIFLLMSFIDNPLYLILLRGSTALFKGAVVPTSWALISDISPSGKVGRKMGLMGSIGMSGFALGPIIGGVLSDTFGFQILWLFVAVECLVGSFIFLLLGSDSSNPRIIKDFSFKKMFKTSQISKISLLCFAYAIFLLGLALLGPNRNVYLVNNLTFTRTMVGLVSFFGTGIATLIQPFMGLYSDKYGRKPFLIIGALSLALGNVVLFLAQSIFLVIFAQILIDNYAIFQYTGSAYVSDVVEKNEKSFAMGIYYSVGSFARAIGALVGGYIISITSVPSILLISPIFPIIGLLIILFLLKERR